MSRSPPSVPHKSKISKPIPQAQPFRRTTPRSSRPPPTALGRTTPQSTHPPPTSPAPAPPQTFRRGALGISGVAIFTLTSSLTYYYSTLNRPPPATPPLLEDQDVSDRYNTTAATFDAEVSRSENWLGIWWLRRRLVRKAWGDVLEVSVGTGRNAEYFDLTKCESLTMVDQSAEMTEIARAKFRALHPTYKPTTFLTQSALTLPVPPIGKTYNTILQSMGLCSTPYPVTLLQHLGTLADPENGQILLLEHGRSHYEWLNRKLDETAPAHADKHGCWWNRDIGRIVEQSGLEVVSITRWHLGTTWAVELRPKKEKREGGEKEME